MKSDSHRSVSNELRQLLNARREVMHQFGIAFRNGSPEAEGLRAELHDLRRRVDEATR